MIIAWVMMTRSRFRKSLILRMLNNRQYTRHFKMSHWYASCPNSMWFQRQISRGLRVIKRSTANILEARLKEKHLNLKLSSSVSTTNFFKSCRFTRKLKTYTTETTTPSTKPSQVVINLLTSARLNQEARLVEIPRTSTTNKCPASSTPPARWSNICSI